MGGGGLVLFETRLREGCFPIGGLFSIFHKKSASKAPKTCDFAYFTSQWGARAPPQPPPPGYATAIYRHPKNSPISKILEKLIHVRAINFFNKHSVLLPTQYGFRANHSTSHALTNVLTSLHDNINDAKYTALLLLDLKKAFDTVNHKTLLTKLEHYGIRGPTLDLFASFLTNRFQYASLENQSNLKKINYGVP